MTDETRELIEEKIVDGLVTYDSMEIGSKERAAILNETTALLDKLTTIDKDRMEYSDKTARRVMEEKRNDETAEIERTKLDLYWKRGIEIAKVVVPVIVPLFAYGYFQTKVLTFEETGRITSTAGRELHLPKIFNK